MTDTTWVKVLMDWSAQLERELPWREKSPRDPYRVWISEIMLQQTRTEAVKPYFNAWMEKFPTVHALAEASEAEVLHAWQGLGYYSRARNIHAAARKMDSHYGGRVPDELKAVESLPGIGSYTAGAILSIAYGKRTSAVDGNVLRIYARLYGIEEDILKAKGRRQVMNCVEQTLPEDAGSFNEALMDLGQEVCIPRFPRCSECPIASWCRAHREGKEKELPVRTKKKRQETLYLAAALILRHGAFLMHKRPEKGMLASMWEFPVVLAHTPEEAEGELGRRWNCRLEGPVWKHRHVFSHRIWNMNAYVAAPAIQEPMGKDYAFFTPEEYRNIPLAGPHAQLAAWAEKLGME